jgi:beta-lactam-binding protein with PASTA domain
MPNLVGTNLQEAQNRIQALTGDQIFFTNSHDATDANRLQVLDANWKVCSQNVRAGSRITQDSQIDFGAVKLAESCP